ncbi:MAG: threonylcarbamoyl-AMP synthase [Myxococcales bacterium]|nr:threonylcarbamoyl-AMP synthase [Myxococcales bacterium]
MFPPVPKTPLRSAEPATIALAASILADGGVVAIPTETVYGLAADGLDPRAVARIFAAKGRPADNPLILHVAGLAEAEAIAAEVPPLARALADAFWPGPLTIVLKRAAVVPEIVSAGLDTVAIRVPAHPVALAILRALGRPLAAPSANRSGRPSPTRAEHVLADLDGRIDLIVDGGPTAHGIESTVIDLSQGEGAPLLLRQGALPREALEAALGRPIAEGGAEAAARSPGLRHRHYAPRARVELVAREGLGARAEALAAAGVRVGVLARAPAPPLPPAIPTLAAEGGLEGYARELFAGLRTLDELGVARIVAETTPEVGIGRAIMDRLRRAAEG